MFGKQDSLQFLSVLPGHFLYDFKTTNMFVWAIKVLLLATLYVANLRASQNWYYLKLPFSMNPLFGFYDQPRTVEEADNAGWTKVDDSVDCKSVNDGA